MVFNIVQFSDGLHVIPFSWLSDDNKKAYWPLYDDTWRICKAVVNMEAPVKDSWKLFDVLAILGSSDKYPDATEKLKLMQDASDLENFRTEETLKKTRARRHRRLPTMSTDESEGEAPESTLVEASASHKTRTSGANRNAGTNFPSNFPKKPANFITVIDDVTIKKANQHNSKNQPPQRIEPRAEDITVENRGTQHIARHKTADGTKNSIETPEFVNLEEYHKELLRIMNKVSSIVEDLDKRLKMIEDTLKANTLEPPRMQTINDVDAEEDLIENMLPLGTLEEFDEFDKRLHEKQFASRVVKFMRTIGGRDTHAFLFNVLKRCLKNSIAKEYSMDGKKKKKQLRPTCFLKTILRAAKLHRPNSDEIEAIKIISSWLAGAKLRFTREEAKLLQGLELPIEQDEIREQMAENEAGEP